MLAKILPFLTILVPGAVNAANLEPVTLKAWEEYVESAKTRMQQRLGPDKTFLWVDEAPERLAKLRAGEILVAPEGPHMPKRVPSGLIHDWIGAVFIPHASLADALSVVSDYAHYKDFYKPAVIDSRATAVSKSKAQFSLVLMNKSFFLKSALLTDYESHYVSVDSRRGYTISMTTRVQEVDEYGTPDERVLPEGQGRGIIWRLFGITRYVERNGGVYIEIEALGLSRDIPASLRWLVEPVVRRVSRSAVITSLEQTADAIRQYITPRGRPAGEGSARIQDSRAH